MTKSLNQAFIKAYSKEKLGHRNLASDAPPQDPNESLMMRFDTVTVPIPKPHLLQHQHRTEKVASEAAREAPVPVHAASRAAASETREPELRESIASQMLRASHWEEQRLDAFLGGFPMLSALHGNLLKSLKPEASHPAARPSTASTLEPKQTKTIQSDSSQSEVKSKQLEASRTGPRPARPPAIDLETESTSQEKADEIPAPRHSMSNAAQTETAPSKHGRVPVAGRKTEQPTANEEPPSLIAPVARNSFRDGITNEEPPSLVSPEAPVARNSFRVGVTNEEPPSLIAPAAPAISSHAQTERAPAAHNLQSPLREGEIFRLDRPTYAGATRSDDDHDQDSGQASSIVETPFDERHEDASRPTTKSQAKSRLIEESLRESKMRIFNPVWEVDNLQWPEICLELLDHNAADVERVAENLLSACQEGLQILAITSPHSGEGRTTVACCLAILAGNHGLKVAILDGDIDNPSLSIQTNLDVDIDWKAAIVNQLPLEEVAVHSIDDQVTIVPLLRPIGQTELASNDARIAAMLQELSESFDLVIVDMGHMQSQRNLVTALAEQGIISAVVAVVDRRSSSQQIIDACVRRIRQSGIASIGLIENFAA